MNHCSSRWKETTVMKNITVLYVFTHIIFYTNGQMYITSTVFSVTFHLTKLKKNQRYFPSLKPESHILNEENYVSEKCHQPFRKKSNHWLPIVIALPNSAVGQKPIFS